MPTISSEMCFLDLAYHGSFDRSWRLNRVGRRGRGSIWTIPMSVYWDPTDAIHYLKLEIHSWATNGILSLKLLLTDVSMDSTHCVMFQSFSSKSLERGWGGWLWYIWDSWQFLMRSVGAAIAGSCQLLSKLGMDAAEPGALIWSNRIQTASLTIWQIPILISELSFMVHLNVHYSSNSFPIASRGTMQNTKGQVRPCSALHKNWFP